MIKLLAERAVKKDDYLYMVSKEAGMLFSINLKTGKIKLEYCLENENFFESRLYGDIKIFSDKIIVIPANSTSVCMIDIKDNIIREIKISEKYGYQKHMTSQIVGNNLYMFGHGVLSSKVVNLVSYEVSELEEFKEELFYSSTIADNIIYLPSCKTNMLYCYDIEAGRVDGVNIGVNSFNGICISDNKCYLAPRNSSKLYIFDLIDKSIIEHEIPFCNAIGIIKIGNEIYVPTDSKDKSFKINSINEVVPWKKDKSFILAYDAGDEYILMSDGAELIVINKISKEERTYMSVVSKELFTDFVKENKINRKIYNKETNINNLEEYIESI